MIERYENFLRDFDRILRLLFELQKEYINCTRGCFLCCDKGDYPFSWQEFSYLTQGFINLEQHKKIIVQQNIRRLLKEKEEYKGERFVHICPFLINGECSVYKYRGILCRTFGIAYYDDTKGYVRLPDCVNFGKNYSKFYDKETKILNIENVIKVNLRIDRIFSSELAHSYKLDCGEIRPMLDWLKN